MTNFFFFKMYTQYIICSIYFLNKKGGMSSIRADAMSFTSIFLSYLL